MEHAVRLAIPFALAAVTCVLLAGLWNMVRGGNPNLSQKLMRWRVLLQFIALCFKFGNTRHILSRSAALLNDKFSQPLPQVVLIQQDLR